MGSGQMGSLLHGAFADGCVSPVTMCLPGSEQHLTGRHVPRFVQSDVLDRLHGSYGHSGVSDPDTKGECRYGLRGQFGHGIADVIAVTVLQWNMRGHSSIPSPDVSVHQVLMCFGNLALAYGAAIVVPDLHREHAQPQRMPRVVVITILFTSAFFIAIALAGYTAGGCQLSGNILYSIVSTSEPLGLAPLGFTADRGAVVMAYLFMQIHITIAFSTLMMPPFYMAERLVLGMHVGPKVVRYNDAEERVNVEHDLELQGSYVRSSTPNMSDHQVSTSSLVDKTEGRMSQLRVVGDEITEQRLHEPYRGARNALRYITLRICIIVILVVCAVLARKRFLDLVDFTGATAHTTSCLLMPLIIYLRVFWRKMSFLDKGASIIVIAVCAAAGCYVMIYAGKELFTPSDDETLFPYCETEFIDKPYYIRNSTNY